MNGVDDADRVTSTQEKDSTEGQQQNQDDTMPKSAQATPTPSPPEMAPEDPPTEETQQSPIGQPQEGQQEQKAAPSPTAEVVDPSVNNVESSVIPPSPVPTDVPSPSTSPDPDAVNDSAPLPNTAVPPALEATSPDSNEFSAPELPSINQETLKESLQPLPEDPSTAEAAKQSGGQESSGPRTTAIVGIVAACTVVLCAGLYGLYRFNHQNIFKTNNSGIKNLLPRFNLWTEKGRQNSVRPSSAMTFQSSRAGSVIITNYSDQARGSQLNQSFNTPRESTQLMRTFYSESTSVPIPPNAMMEQPVVAMSRYPSQRFISPSASTYLRSSDLDSLGKGSQRSSTYTPMGDSRCTVLSQGSEVQEDQFRDLTHVSTISGFTDFSSSNHL